MYRSKEERDISKQGGVSKNSNWFCKLGYKAALALPASQDDKLVQMVKSKLKQGGFKDIMVYSNGGKVTSSNVVKSNPFSRSECERKECMMCSVEPSKGRCTRAGSCYTITCNRLPCKGLVEGEVDRLEDLEVPMARYAGESSRTLYTRGAKHLALYTGSNAQKSTSFMWRHCQVAHGGIMGTEDGLGDFRMDQVSSHRDPLSRVLREALEIQELENNEIGWKTVNQDGRKIHCLNSKQEYFQNVIPRTVQIRGNLQEF